MAAVLKACTYLLFGDFSIANIPFIWVNIKFNFYELDSRDVYSLHVKTQWQVFFFFFRIFVFLMQRDSMQHGVSIQLQSSTKLGNAVHQIICNTKNRSDMSLGKTICAFIFFHLLWIEWFWLYFLTACLWKIHFLASLHTDEQSG